MNISNEKINPSSPNSPSLNDILKPLLEERGWKQRRGGYVDQDSGKMWHGIHFIKLNLIIELYDGISEVLISKLTTSNSRTLLESLHPSDPQFFEKLEKWLEE